MAQATTAETGIRFLGVKLAPGVTRGNLLANYYGALFGLCLFTLLGAIQAFILTSIVKVPLAEQGRVTGRLGLAQEIAMIATLGLFGALSDKIGRRPVYVLGFVVMAVAYLLYPTATEVNQLLVYRVVFALGTAAVTVMFSTVIADYALDASRGRASGWQGICNGVGAILSGTLFLKLPDIFQKRAGMDYVGGLRATMYVAAGVALISALVLWLGLKRGVVAQAAERKPFGELLREGFAAARQPGIRLAYAAAFVSRGDLALVGQFLILWLNKYGLESAGLSEDKALAQARFGFVIVQLAAFVAAPAIGYLADRLNRALALAICVGIAAVGYSSLFFIQNPLSGVMKLALLVVGVGEIGGALASQVLIAQLAPREVRGSVIGVFNLFGALGILTAFGVGGYLFDHWRESSPFLLFGVLGAFVAAWGFAIQRQVKPAEA